MNILEYVEFKKISSEPKLFLGMYSDHDCEVDYNQDDIPVIVTGSSSNHFIESLHSLDNLKNVLMNKLSFNRAFRLVYYNLGLTSVEVNVIQSKCRCEICDFPFEIFPEHVRNLSNFAWKPIIIRRMLYEEDFVMWVDATIRFAEGRNTSDIFRKARQNGLQCMVGQGNIAERTATETMEFLKQEPEVLLNYTEVQGGFGIYSRTHFTLNNVVDPWVRCALDVDCI